MRINRIELARFGKFEDCRIDLPKATPDLHLIVGPNEAGKSTLRAALGDLFFGIDSRTPYNFLHAYSDLRIGAEIVHAGDTLAFARLKRNRDSLRDVGDRAMSDERLASFLGGVDRSMFERMFALDRRQLEAGGLEILHAKNDLGRMLFEAAAGPIGLGQLRQDLEDEADAVWGRRRKQSRVYYAARDRLDAANRRLREVTVRERDWSETRRKVDDATTDLDQAAEKYRQLEGQRARLDRIRRVAPPVSDRRDRLLERAALGPVVLLPKEASARVQAAEATLAGQATVIAQQEALIAKADAELQRVTVDQRLLAHRDAVLAANAERSRLRDHTAGIAKRQAEVEVLRSDVAGLLRQLGWPRLVEGDTAEEELARRIPSRVLTAAVQDLISEHGRLAEAERSAVEALADVRRDRDLLDRELCGLADRAVPAKLIAARDVARTFGPANDRRDDLTQAADAARRRLDASLDDLVPKPDSIDALRELRPPDEAAAQALSSHQAEIADTLRILRAKVDDAEQELQRLRLKREQIVRDRQPPTSEEIAGARRSRDALWNDILDGRAKLPDSSQAYEAAVVNADEMADRRYREAADAQKLEGLRAEVERRELDVALHKDAIAAKEDEGARLRSQWKQGLPRALADLTPAAVPEWRRGRRRVLEQSHDVTAAEGALRQLDEAIGSAAEDLRAALSNASVPTEDLAGLSFAGLLVKADAVVSAFETTQARRQELLKQRDRLDGTMKELAVRAEASRATLDDWQDRWSASLTTASLSPDLTPGAARAAGELLAQLSEKLDRISDLRRARIATMQRDLDAYASAAAALAEDIAPDLSGCDAETIATTLATRLEEADKARDRLERATTERAEALKVRAEARSLQDEARAELQPLLDRAGVDTFEALRDAVARSERAAAIDTAIDIATRLILENGDGLSLASLEAEVDGEDLPSLVPRLAELEEEREAARAERDRGLLAKRDAESELARIDGASAAAEAEAERQEALADMAAAAERYVTAFVGARLVGWAIDRFRAETQDPLLTRAGEVFRGLTCGSFAALSVDYDGDAPQLFGSRGDGRHVDVEGMSEGTRDQLYLALRLAAIELHLRTGYAVPFIADDLFVSFDDQRASAAFRALAELACETQVLYLTHHDHLVDVARKAVGDAVNVVSL